MDSVSPVWTNGSRGRRRWQVIQRWKHAGNCMVTEKDGAYVSYDDHAALVEKLVQALAAMFESHCLNACHGTNRMCPVCRNARAAIAAAKEAQR